MNNEILTKVEALMIIKRSCKNEIITFSLIFVSNFEDKQLLSSHVFKSDILMR